MSRLLNRISRQRNFAVPTQPESDPDTSRATIIFCDPFFNPSPLVCTSFHGKCGHTICGSLVMFRLGYALPHAVHPDLLYADVLFKDETKEKWFYYRQCGDDTPELVPVKVKFYEPPRKFP